MDRAGFNGTVEFGGDVGHAPSIHKEISEQLGKSIRTIEEHRAHIMKKMDVDNTVDLLNRSLQVGIVNAEDITPPQKT